MRDVVIVGAGPAGSALAYWLASAGRDVLLLDRAGFPRDKTCGDGLAPRALRVLDRLGLLEQVGRRAARVNRVRLAGPGAEAAEFPLPAGAGRPDYALVLPRLQFDDLLRRHAVAAGAEFRRALVHDVLWAEDQRRVAGVRGETPEGPLDVRARLTVVATGAASGLLERAGVLRRTPSFDRAARVYYVGVRAMSDAYEFYYDLDLLPGYGWVFPAGPEAVNVGVYCPTPNRSGAPPRAALARFLARPRLAARLDGAHPEGPVRGHPLRADFPAAPLAAPGLLIVGEAGGLVNPLTGEGVDCALESAEVAAEFAEPALRRDGLAGLAARYTRALRARFAFAFQVCRWIRDLCAWPALVDRAVAAARRDPDFQRALVHFALGDAAQGGRALPRALWALARG